MPRSHSPEERYFVDLAFHREGGGVSFTRMQNHPNWAALRSSHEGATGPMMAALGNIEVWRGLRKPEMAHTWLEVDRLGRTLWFYTLLKGALTPEYKRNQSADKIYAEVVALMQRALPSSQDSHGQGLLWQLAHPSTPALMKRYQITDPFPNGALAAACKAIPLSEWFAGESKALEEHPLGWWEPGLFPVTLGQPLMFQGVLNRVLRHYTLEDHRALVKQLSPLTVGFLAFQESLILHAHDYPLDPATAQAVRQRLGVWQAHARLPEDPAVCQHWAETCALVERPKAWAYMEALESRNGLQRALTETLVMDPPASTPRRMRL